MTTDQKIDEVLKVVREQGDRSELRFVQNEEKIDAVLKIVREHDLRFVRNEGKIDEVLRIVREQGERNDLRFDRLEAKDEELSKDLSGLRTVFIEERQLNNARFSQMEHSMTSLHKEVRQMNCDLNGKIDRMSADIQGLGEELYETKRGMSLKKKPLS